VQTKHDPGKLADRVFDAVYANDYGQFDGLIALMTEALGRDGLQILKARFETFVASLSSKLATDDRRVIGFSTARSSSRTMRRNAKSAWSRAP